MPTATYAGHTVTVNDEGFFENPDEWTEEMAPEIAKAEGINELTESHWQVIEVHASRIRREGNRPDRTDAWKDLRRISKELYQLFPKGPAKTAAKIAGIPKPARGCI